MLTIWLLLTEPLLITAPPFTQEGVSLPLKQSGSIIVCVLVDWKHVKNRTNPKYFITGGPNRPLLFKPQLQAKMKWSPDKARLMLPRCFIYNRFHCFHDLSSFIQTWKTLECNGKNGGDEVLSAWVVFFVFHVVFPQIYGKHVLPTSSFIQSKSRFSTFFPSKFLSILDRSLFMKLRTVLTFDRSSYIKVWSDWLIGLLSIAW